MISNWREISCRDATCCGEAREAVDVHFKQLSLHPDSISHVVKCILEGLPPSSHTALMIRQKKSSEISICLQTLVTLISSKFSLLSSCAEAHLIEVSFQKMNFGLVQLLEDGGSTLCFFVPHKLYLHSVSQFFDHRQRLQHFIYIFHQMRSISEKFQSHYQRNPSNASSNPLFGTTLKTSKETRHSKLTQFDCLFDAYAKIICQYRAKFSGLKNFLALILA